MANHTFQTEVPIDLQNLRVAYEGEVPIKIELVASNNTLYSVHHLPKTFNESPITGEVTTTGQFGILGYGTGNFQQDGSGTVVLHNSFGG